MWVSLQNTIKDPQWYTVQGSDTTMMTKASAPGQQKKYIKLETY